MNLLQLSIPCLVSAVQTADSGGFTAAATALDLTPAAVSKNVAVLESQLGIRLFNRTTRRVTLTEEGKQFIPLARQGLVTLQEAAASAASSLAPQGLVRVNCAVGFGRRYVIPALPDFFAAYPDVQIELALNDQHVDLVADGFDVGIRGGSQPPEGMVARKICDMHVVLVATPRYLKTHGTPKHYQELSRHRLLRVKFLSGKLAPWLFKDAGRTVAFEGGAQLYISDPEVILDAALTHMGIARMGRHHAHEAIKHGALVELLAQQNVRGDAAMSIFYPHRAGLAPRVRVFVDFLLEYLAKQEGLGL
jgi:DNA-binding transcriptional LysR family regulator